MYVPRSRPRAPTIADLLSRRIHSDTKLHHKMAETSNYVYSKDSSTPVVRPNRSNHSIAEGDVQENFNVKDQLDTFEDMANRARTMLWS
jgi:hypothetical protein